MFPIRDNVPSKTFPVVNYFLIIINVAVFLKEVQWAHRGLFEPMLFSYGLVPDRFLTDPLSHIINPFTSMFLHGSWGHVLGNMWFLYIFGDNVEDNLGHARYFFYYLLMGLGASAIQVASNPGSSIPMVGASGAIAGVLGSYLVLYPKARVLTAFVIVIFIRLVDVPAFFFLGVWFLMQAVNGVGALSASAIHGDVGGVAWWAHAGGFAVGFLCIPFMRKKKPPRR